MKTIACLAALLLSPVASAQGWSAYGEAFPELPCPDGWASCVIDGNVVSAGTVADSSGRVQPAGNRFGFWDFEALPAQDPFAPLSAYTGRLGTERKLVSAEEDDEEPTGQAEPKSKRDRKRELEKERRAGERDEADADPYEEDDGAAAAERAAADAADAAAADAADAADAAAAEAAAAEAAAAEAAAAEAAAAEAAAAEAAAAEAAAADGTASLDNQKDTGSAYVEEDEGCDDLVAMEGSAMLGQLGKARRQCLEGSLSSSGRQTSKSKISRVLIADARARKDRPDWERLMKRHLEDIDQSDPDMCLSYAIHLNRSGRSHSVIKWATRALDNKAEWSGRAFTKKVYQLHRLRATAAHGLWERADKAFIQERNDSNEAAAGKYRSKAKTYAREWLDYAKASGQDTSKPVKYCVSAAGNLEYCPG